MIRLLVAASAPPEESPETRFGGRPLVSSAEAFVWPVCAECGGALQFLGQIALPTEGGTMGLLLLFMCISEWVCSTWETDSGANHACIVSGHRFELASPARLDATVLRRDTYGAIVVNWPGDDYDDARETWGEAHAGERRMVLGQYEGRPGWIQNDETPVCDCGRTMAFVAQLEEGPSHDTSMNFGGGSAYIFRCGDHAAKMLWQQ